MKNRRVLPVLSILVVFTLIFAPSYSALADGGIIYPDPAVWAQIDEGQQIGVITLVEGNDIKVDLFITMVDNTGQSHEVVFFLPLGKETTDFNVIEEKSRDFDEALTQQLDENIRSYGESEARYKTAVQGELLLGTLVTNGLWTWLVALPLLSSSCAQAPAPKATYATESSFIALYDMEEGVDIDALIASTGLDPSVKDTLKSLKGQEIAVVTVQTQPKAAEDESWEVYGEEQGQPGIHLSWYAAMQRHPEGSEYVYPLGTGRAWASPIELTRIYIVAPSGTDFKVTYPKLGTDLSGLEGRSWVTLAERINWKIDSAVGSAYAIDEAFGSFGHIWRATYVKSNSDTDISVIKLTKVSEATRSALGHRRFHQVVTNVSWLFALLVGAAAWVFSWWLVMTRVAKIPYRWKEGRLYGDAFLWSVIYPFVTFGLLMVIGFIIFGLLSSFIFLYDSALNNPVFGYAIGLLVASPLLLGLVGLINAFFFARFKARKLDIRMGRAMGAYMLTILLANVLYALVTVPYAALVGAL